MRGEGLQRIRTILIIIVLAFASSSLMGADGNEQGAEDRARLEARQKQLAARIDSLKAEQDFLLFQNAMSTVDSKYLILNLSAMTGQLKYKNRVLKDFFISGTSKRAFVPANGAVTLTEKIENPRGKNLMVFADAFVLQGKRPPASTTLPKKMLRLSLAQKDFMAMYYAVEAGAKAYILR